MTKLKTAAKDFLKAGETLVKTTIDEVSEKVAPVIEDVKTTIHQEKVKHDLAKNKVADVERDTSRRKFHRTR